MRITHIQPSSILGFWYESDFAFKLLFFFILLLLFLQLSLTQSDISHIGSMKVEGIVHPTTAEIDLKEEIGEALLHAKKNQI